MVTLQKCYFHYFSSSTTLVKTGSRWLQCYVAHNTDQDVAVQHTQWLRYKNVTFIILVPLQLLSKPDQDGCNVMLHITRIKMLQCNTHNGYVTKMLLSLF